MIKKTLLITLKGGRQVRRDLTLEQLEGVPFGAPANHEGYLQLCLYIAQTGTTDVDKTDEKHLTLIAPASIETVEVIFANE